MSWVNFLALITLILFGASFLAPEVIIEPRDGGEPVVAKSTHELFHAQVHSHVVFETLKWSCSLLSE